MTIAELEWIKERKKAYFPPQPEPEPERKPQPAPAPMPEQAPTFDLYGELARTELPT